ncbi:hypothetical protein S40288_07669 [Stachybotrys chartarum IBT 40288]|nr:hypothetical protein S40288_07669 [Stachybotrys chartarum IBT 40288]
MAKTKGLSISLIEILNLVIGKALAFDSNESRVETIISLTDIRQNENTIEALFKYNATSSFKGTTLNLLASARITITVGDSDHSVLPLRGPREPGLSKVDPEDFYGSLLSLNYQYTGDFKALSRLERRLGHATGHITNTPSKLIIHPAVLDAAFQSVLLAHCAPNSGGIWSLHVPKHIRAIRLNTTLCNTHNEQESLFSFDCTMPPGASLLEGDIDIFANINGAQHAMIQVEALLCVPFSVPLPRDDRSIFATMKWDVATPDAFQFTDDGKPTEEQLQLAHLLDRMALVYLRRLDNVPKDDPARSGPYEHYFRFASHTLSIAMEGKLPLWSRDWERDSSESLVELCKPYSDFEDLKLLKAFGENIVEIATGQTQAIEIGMEDELLSNIYERGLGFQQHIKILAQVVKQIIHRYPYMNILEVGAGTGGATRKIFEEIDGKFSSYTYTDISAGFFEGAKQKFASRAHSMIFKTLDISKNPEQQGFQARSFDLIVAFAVLHASKYFTTPCPLIISNLLNNPNIAVAPSLADTLGNVRYLLKPGGFLVVLELQPDNVARVGTVFGALPGWWVGSHEGRTQSPCVSLADWDDLLRCTGFSGCDSVSSSKIDPAMPMSVFVSQAVDSRVEFLREPLMAPTSLFENMGVTANEELILLGGDSFKTRRALSQLKVLLRRHWGPNIVQARSLTDLMPLNITPSTTVLSLVELDSPVLDNPGNRNWEALKSLLQTAGTILWVTSGRRAENPYANMIVGLLRAARQEIPTLSFQAFDAEVESDTIDIQDVAETLLRLKAGVMWQRRDGADSLLMTTEPELVREKGGKLVIPRLVPNLELNERYNSKRRQIINLVRPNGGNLALSGPSEEQHISLREMPQAETVMDPMVKVTHSFRSAIRVSTSSFAYLVLGRSRQSGAQVVALVSHHASLVVPLDGLSSPVSVPPGNEAVFLALLAYRLVAISFLEAQSKGMTVVICGLEGPFSAVLQDEAMQREIKVVSITTSKMKAGSTWITIHPKASDRAIRALIPKNVAVLIDLHAETSPESLGTRLRAQLPKHCLYHSSRSSFVFASESEIQVSQVPSIRTQFEKSIQRCTSLPANFSFHVPTISLKEFSGGNRGLPQSVIDWTHPVEGLDVRVRPADTHVQFSESKTYWLAGLSGGLGLLLCEWMVRHGAKYIAISSRNPSIEMLWLERMRASGVVVKTFSCDITDKIAVSDIYVKITSAMPAIGGVCQGATLAEQRRRRGQVASVMHIGPVFGVGYINQQGLDSGSKSTSILKSMFPLSEEDFCQHFAEAVIAGRSTSRSKPLEVVTGVRKFESAEDGGVLMSHYTQFQNEAAVDLRTQKSKTSLKAQLAEARERTQVAQIISEALLLKLGTLFQIDLSQLQPAELKRTRLDEMGIDSLMAVEIRSWFFKSFQVNIPVLKILGGAVIADLIDTAVDGIPQFLVPGLDVGTSDAPPGGQNPLQEEKHEASPAQRQSTLMNNSTHQKPAEIQLSELSLQTFEPHTHPRVPSPDALVTFEADHSELLDMSHEGEVDIPSFGDSESRSTQTQAFTPLIDDKCDYFADPSVTLITNKDVETSQLLMPVTPFTTKSCQLSFGQSLFWFSTAFSNSPTNLNLTGTFRLNGAIDVEKMKRAVMALGQQHESLRTCFRVHDGLPSQVIMNTSTLNLEHYLIRHENELQSYIDSIHNGVYEIHAGKIIRLALVSISADHHFFIIGVHHLAMDGQSFFPLMKDMLLHYSNKHEGMTAMQYPDFSESQRVAYASGNFSAGLAFWKSELADMPPFLPILRTSSLTSRPMLQVYGNRHVELRIGGDTKALVHTVCRRNRTTPFHFYLAVVRVLLYRYTGSEHFSIGIGDANRNEERLMGSIGDFVNLLPLTFRTNASQHFDDVLRDTRSKAYSGLAYSHVPFQLLLDELRVARTATAPPIFQAFVDYRLARGEKMTWGDCQLELLSFQTSKMAYDIAVDIIDNADGDCRFEFIVRDDIYTQEDVQQLADSYALLCEAFASQPHRTLGQAEIFEETQLKESLEMGRGPVHQADASWLTVIHRVDIMARTYPHSTAVISANGTVATYDEVVRSRVDSIVADLQDSGITTGSRIGVLQESTADWISSIIAIMRIGATYLPLDVGVPWARLSVIIQDCKPQAVLVDQYTKQNVHKLEFDKAKVINVSESHRQGHWTPILAAPNVISMIIYTSGSSGTPKGIELTHQGMRSWLEPCGTLYNLRPGGEVVLQQSSQGFDMSLMQIFTALCFGNSVCLVPQKFRGDARAISELMVRHCVTHTYGTPSEYLSWLKYGSSKALKGSSWKTALVGGEPLTTSVLQEFAAMRKDDLHFYHMYGTTEATFCAAIMELKYREEVQLPGSRPRIYPAGVALPNYRLYVLDDEKKPLPAGIQGEIYIGGAGVAKGYLGNPRLTEQTFVSDPFATSDDLARGWAMMQRTGDLGRWSRENHRAIIVEGRISGDTMVKLRGFRVDLREVEAAMLQSGGGGMLSSCIVSVRQNSSNGSEFLVAHVVFIGHEPQKDDQLNKSRVEQLYSELELPFYMRPALIIALDAIPITSSGKLDRNAVAALVLPKFDVIDITRDYTPIEQRLKCLWERVLSRNLSRTQGGITQETDFFHIGGTSLLLLELRQEVRNEFQVDLELVDLFQASVLSSMARRIEGQVMVPAALDWDEETELPTTVAETDSGMLQKTDHFSCTKVVVLTGGTGYLGKALTEALAMNPTVKEIHCIGVRNIQSRNDLKSLSKVTLHEGDLTQHQMGLSQSVIDDLFSRADLIIHNGADVSYLKTYQSMRQSNFLTTKDLVGWSMPRMIPFHYISTAGLGNLTKGSVLTETSVASTPPPRDGSMGYTACKWASERFLERLVERHPQWPICIHRPTLISRDDIPELDGMHNILGYARKLRAVPMSQGVARGVVNVVRLETVVKGVLACALPEGRDEHERGSGGNHHHCPNRVHIVNHIGKLDLPLGNMRKWALKRTSDGDVDFSYEDFDEIPMEEWIRRASQVGMHPAMASLLSTFSRDGEVEFPTIVKG